MKREKRTYAKGSPAPDGYIQWHEWAKDQHAHGLRQKQCATCGLWNFPQETCNHKTRSGIEVSK